MALPTPVKTWQFNVNQTISTGTVLGNNKAILLNLKNALIGFSSTPWTIRYSCDSVTAGTAGDGVDRWSTVANVVFASAGTAHSWFVLKQAGLLTNAQLLISASGEAGGAFSSTNYNLSLLFSPSAGFTGGSATARPTATDEITICQVNTGLGGASPSAGATVRAHFMQSTDGACTRMILASANVSCVVMQIEAVANSVTGWSNPFYVGISYCSNGVPFPAATAGTFTNYSNTAAVTGITRSIKVSSTLGAAVWTTEGNNQNLSYADTNYGNIANEIDSSWSLYPIGLACTTVGIRGRVGTLIDMWLGSLTVPTGDTYDTSSKTFAQWGQLVTPWDGTTTPAIA